MAYDPRPDLERLREQGIVDAIARLGAVEYGVDVGSDVGQLLEELPNEATISDGDDYDVIVRGQSGIAKT